MQLHATAHHKKIMHIIKGRGDLLILEKCNYGKILVKLNEIT